MYHTNDGKTTYFEMVFFTVKMFGKMLVAVVCLAVLCGIFLAPIILAAEHYVSWWVSGPLEAVLFVFLIPFVVWLMYKRGIVSD